MQTVALDGGVQIGLCEARGGFLGLGRVQVGGVDLRNPRRPMLADIRTPDAVQLCNYRLEGITRTGETTVLALTMSRRDGDLMDWMLHEVRNRRRLADWTAQPSPAEGTRLELWLRPVERTFGDRTWRGFSYQYRYASCDLPIYRLLDRGTWEPGGRAVGCEFWLRNTFAPPIAPFRAAEDAYCTEWYLPGQRNPSVFQFLPFQTQLPGFTFTASDAGLLVTWATECRHIRSLFEKPRCEDAVVHWHEHCDDLNHSLTTSPMEVLFSPGPAGRVERINAWESVRDAVSRHLHERVGARVERVRSYGMIEEWNAPDMVAYTERGLPALLDAGVRMVGLANHFENNMNVWGVADMCCTVDLKFAERVGEESMLRFCRRARKGGAVVQMWGNTALSSLTPWFQQRNGATDRVRFLPPEQSIMAALDSSADPWVHNPTGAVEADRYAPRFAVLNLRDPVVREYWHRQWQAAHDVGLGGIFLDSSFNLSSDKLSYRPLAEPGPQDDDADRTDLPGRSRPDEEPPAAVQSQYLAHLDLLVEMQQMGYAYCGEDTGVFGVHRHGPAVEARLDNLFLWPECLAAFDGQAVRAAGHQPDDVYFRGLAYRLVWILYWHVPTETLSFLPGGPRTNADVPTDWHLAVLAAFNEAEPRMIRRHVLPGEAGVLWRDDAGGGAVWAFEDIASLDLGGTFAVRDLLADGGRADLPATGTLDAAARGVYLLKPRQTA